MIQSCGCSSVACHLVERDKEEPGLKQTYDSAEESRVLENAREMQQRGQQSVEDEKLKARRQNANRHG